MNIKHIITQLPKWIRMFLGKSVLTVEQGVGKAIHVGSLYGYYNDFTKKVSDRTLIDNNGIPYNITNSGEHIYTPVSSIQYSLGLFDQYILTNACVYITRMKPIIENLLNNQHLSGGWSVDLLDSSKPYYSAMVQGEAISLLCRAKFILPEYEYDDAITNAYAILMRDIEDGGCVKYENEKIYMMEYADSSFILNGGIFALWGLYDYCLSEYGDDRSRELLLTSVKTLAHELPKFDLKYWSKYSLDGKVASPFYHNLHIAQLQVLEMQFPEMGFGEIASLYREYEKSKLRKLRATIVKGMQKFREEPRVVIVK